MIRNLSNEYLMVFLLQTSWYRCKNWMSPFGHGWTLLSGKEHENGCFRPGLALHGALNFNLKNLGQVIIEILVCRMFFDYLKCSDHNAIVRVFHCGGIKGRRQEIDLFSLGLSSYVFLKAHPALQRLCKALVFFLVQWHSEFLEPSVSIWIFV
jgi:hypothetical protein